MLKFNSFLCNYVKNNIKFLIRQQRCLLSSNNNNKNESPDSITNYLQKKIKIKGPLTVAEFMKEALANPKWGYYMKNDVFGSRGDFITSPEISQIFGELIGIWFLNEWMNLKHFYGENLPEKIQLVELGPGRGTLMKDIIKVWNKVQKDLNVFMIESSPVMRKIQLKTLCGENFEDEQPELSKIYESKLSNTIKITWLSDLSQMPKLEAPQFFLANEFFDALPIQKFQKTSEGHREILVDISEKENTQFEFKISKTKTVGSNYILKLKKDHENFDHVEVSSDAARNIEFISKQISEMNGSMLLVDYGHDGTDCNDTFRAFKDHKLVENVFERIGECDLTADVDFGFLKHIAKNSDVSCYGPVSQEKFLNNMQIGHRLKILLETCEDEEDKKKLISGVQMLTDPEKMGQRFKMMALRKFDFTEPPPGFGDDQIEKADDNDQ